MRLPVVEFFVSVLALVAFLGGIARSTVVLVMCVLTGILVSLQFIVNEFRNIALGFAWILRGIWLAPHVRGDWMWSERAG